MATREQLLLTIDEVSFAVNDLTLFLDTHATDQKALTLMSDYLSQRKTLLQEYESKFEPLTIDCVRIGQPISGKEQTKYGDQIHFNWVDGPVPWDANTKIEGGQK